MLRLQSDSCPRSLGDVSRFDRREFNRVVCQSCLMPERSRIIKIAGFSLVGFCAVSAAASKLPMGMNTAQVAGFCGAFVGALAGRYRKKKRLAPDPAKDQTASPPVSPPADQQ